MSVIMMDRILKKMHNYYAYLYNKVVFDLLEKKLGKGQAALFARSASVGSQKLPVHWGGDCWGTYPSMAESLRGGLSFGLSGFSFWSHDIAGFEQGATPDLYKRWTQFGLLSSHSRYHGNTEYKVPWLYDEEAVDVTRVFTKLKNSLMPYLYRIACESTMTGVPMMRAMVLEFIEDETCHYLDRQYMLGDSLLAAPIFNDQGIVKYYLPKGKWTNFLTNQVVEGEKWHTEEHGYLTLPLMAKENSIIAVGSVESTADYDYLSDVTFHVFELADGSLISTDLYSNKGIKTGWAEAKREGDTIVFKVSETVKNYSVLLRNITKASVSSGTTEVTNEGIVLKSAEYHVEITL